MSKAISISVAGENSLIVYFGDSPSAAIATQIAQTVAYLKTVLGDLLVDLVPSYASLLVIYQPLQTDHYYITSVIRSAITVTFGSPLLRLAMSPTKIRHNSRATASVCQSITALNPAQIYSPLPTEPNSR